jgi:thiol-disulfide isomerase/thioredoxin
MKTSLTLWIGALLTTSACAEYASWTNSEGKTADLELVSVTEEGGEKVGQFRMRNGRSISIKASGLAAADAKRLEEWKAGEAGGTAEAGAASVFDKHLEGNLETLQGKSLRRVTEFQKPTKYYLFYYTASWCGPCQKFTPSLVEFYNEHKPGNSEFEIILVTSDSDEGAMKEYAVDKQMTWPHLKLSRVDRFKKEFQHPGTGIPNLVLTDTEGKLLATSYEGSNYRGPAVVMNHLASLLKK